MATLVVAPAPVTRPIPWSRLTWVVWRRYRPVLLGLGALVAALATYLLISGEHLRTAYAAASPCQPPATSGACQFTWMNFIDAHGDPGFLGPVLLLLPGIVGVFVGAPLLGRELETGVFRYSWTQGVGRMRFAVALLVPAAIGSALIVYGLGLLEAWHNKPLYDGGVRQRLEPSVFPTAGPVVIGWTLAAFAAGVLAGMLVRKVLPALAASFAVWFGLAYLANVLRFHYLAPLTTTRGGIGTHDVEITQWWTKGGVRVGYETLNNLLAGTGAHISGNGIRAEATPGRGTDPLQYLAQHGYVQVTSYQPGSRYWTFQWIELGWLVLLSAALLGGALWLLRRHS
ncbi:MAG: hypothetical protein ACJ72E_17505, partial [Marmoricola sp.]